MSQWHPLREIAGVPREILNVFGSVPPVPLLVTPPSPPRFGGSLRGTPVAGAASWPSPWVPLVGALLSAAGAGLQALLGGSRLLRGLARTRALPLPHVSAPRVCLCVPPLRPPPSRRGASPSPFYLFPQALGRGRLWPLAATAAVAELGVLLGSLDLLAPVLSVCGDKP